ncbi:MAG: hypothetical protein HKN44_14920 [Ilumatobacter sp.]|nr:hypothetical protein [Ilumatobacter sp.]
MAADHATEPTGANVPVACTLTTKQAAHQLVEWTDVQRGAEQITPIDGGVRITLPASMTAAVTDLARREGECCAFLTLSTAVDGDTLTLDVVSENPDGLPVISMLAGIPLP